MGTEAARVRTGGRPVTRRLLCGALCGVSAILACTGLLLLTETSRDQAAYEALAEEVREEDAAADIDWDALRAANAETVAWLSVEGTSIDHPVVQPGEDRESDWYLTHSFWGEASAAGCPYLDARAEATGDHRLVYGHHLGLSSQMFSEIFQAYEQEVFDAVGTALWSTPEEGSCAFLPLMGLTVDQSYAQIQSFTFPSEAALRAWLRALADDASAVSGAFEGRLSSATRVLTLVTCSNVIAGQRERTLLVFSA